VGRKELRYSLKTACVSIARTKAHIVAGHVKHIFLWLRKGGRELTDLSDEQIQELIEKDLRDYIDGIESRYYPPLDEFPFIDRDHFHSYVDTLDDVKNDIMEYLGTGDYRSVEDRVERLLGKNGINGVEKGSTAQVKLCRAMLRADLRSIETEKKQLSSGLLAIPEDVSKEWKPAISQLSPEGAKGPLISEVISQYADEMKRNWREKTKDENLAILSFFVKAVGDVPVQSVTRKTVGEFKQTLRTVEIEHVRQAR